MRQFQGERSCCYYIWYTQTTSPFLRFEQCSSKHVRWFAEKFLADAIQITKAQQKQMYSIGLAAKVRCFTASMTSSEMSILAAFTSN